MNNMRNIAQKCDLDNKGCDFWLFDNNRYAKIGYDELDGEGISSLGWKPFQIESWDKFGGFSICRLLEVQPQLADKFSLKDLGIFKSRYWKGSDKDADFDYAWDCLVKAQPQLSKYRATKPGTEKTSKKKGTRK